MQLLLHVSNNKKSGFHFFFFFWKGHWVSNGKWNKLREKKNHWRPSKGLLQQFTYQIMKPNLVSVPRHWINSWRQSFRWNRKEYLYCFARQMGPQWAYALKTVCPNLDGVVRSFIVMVQRGHDLLLNILLIGWWWGKWESASSTFWFQPVWGLHACGQHTVNFSHLVGVSVSVKKPKDIVMCIPWGGTWTLPQGCIIVSWTPPPLSLHLLSSLINKCLNLPIGTQGRSWRLNESYFL